MSDEDEAKKKKREADRRYSKAHPDRRAAAMRRWRKANPEKEATLKRRYREAHPEKVAELIRRWREANLEKVTEKERQYKEANRERYAARRRQYDKANPQKGVAANRRRRARKVGNGGSHTEAEWQALCDYYMDQCLACGDVPDQLTRDHVVSLVKGGSDDISNIQPLCKSCNSRKNARAIDYRLDSTESVSDVEQALNQ